MVVQAVFVEVYTLFCDYSAGFRFLFSVFWEVELVINYVHKFDFIDFLFFGQKALRSFCVRQTADHR
jgi:hypothetical protein